MDILLYVSLVQKILFSATMYQSSVHNSLTVLDQWSAAILELKDNGELST